MQELLEMLITCVDELRHKQGQRSETARRQSQDSSSSPEVQMLAQKASDYHAFEDELKVLIVQMKQVIEDFDPELAVK